MKNLIDPIEQQAIKDADEIAIASCSNMLKIKFPNPYNYIALKKMFGEECNKDVLIAFVNDVLSKESLERFIEVEFLDLSCRIDAIGDAQLKMHPIDALFTNGKGEQFIIEIGAYPQIISHLEDFEKGILSYARKVYLSDMCEGGKYEKIKCIYFIAILSQEIIDHKSNPVFDKNIVHGPFELKSDSKFLITYFEPRKYDYIKNNLNEWGDLFFSISMNNRLVYGHRKRREPILGKAFRALAIENWTIEQLRRYLKVEANMRMNLSRDDQMYVWGFAQGHYRGESKAKGAIARKLLEEGLSCEKISQATELSLKELDEMQAELNSKKIA